MTPVLQALKEIEHQGKTGVHFVDEKGREKFHSSADLIARAKCVAAGLRARGVQTGEPVVLVVTEPQTAILVILGCMMAGCPPTPIYPPLNLAAVPAFLAFINHVVDRSRATFLVADEQPYRVVVGVGKGNRLRGIEKTANLLSSNGSFEFTGKTENPIAFLQFTSGSTSVPKGVMVTHESLAANLWMIREASHMDRNSCVVTWLPVYHDMGLIGTVLNAITLPCKLVVLPPLLFLKKPRLWLELITRHRGTHTAAPNFAHGLCVRRVEDVSNLDLGSMTTFICGAEPVMPKTMEAFVAHYRNAGLSPGAMVPAYGLAEATLAVTFTPHGRGLASETVDLLKLSTERFAEPIAAGNSHGLRVSSCGPPMAGLQVRVASEAGVPLPERNVGEIQIAGPTVTPGYIGDDEATRASRTVDGWLRTGDLGYMAGGELYPCGRTKEMIIVRGKNYHAHDLEYLASEVAGVRTGNVVAFGLQKESGEVLVVVAETRDMDKQKDLAKHIRSHLAESIGIAPDDVVVVPAGTLPKTSSGKLKRLETRTLYERNTLLEKPSSLAALGTILKNRIFPG